MRKIGEKQICHADESDEIVSSALITIATGQRPCFQGLEVDDANYDVESATCGITAVCWISQQRKLKMQRWKSGRAAT